MITEAAGGLTNEAEPPASSSVVQANPTEETAEVPQEGTTEGQESIKGEGSRSSSATSKRWRSTR